MNTSVQGRMDPQSGNCGSGHFERSLICTETRLDINHLQQKKKTQYYNIIFVFTLHF